MQTVATRLLQNLGLGVVLGIAGVLQAFALAWPFEGA